MEKEQGMLNRSNYRNDQRASGNTLPGEIPILGLTHVKADQSIAQEKVERLTLLFVLSGNLYFSTAGIENQPVDEGHMFLVLAGDNFYMRAITEVTLLRCAPPLETLYKRMADIVSDSPSRERKRIPVLPLQALLLRELHTIQEMMRAGILSPYVQRLKTELVLSVLRELYAKGKNYDFRPYEEKSLAWYRKAAENGDMDAQYRLGRCYYYGLLDTKPDYGMSFHWLSQAAAQSHERAQYHLGVLYQNGEGVKQDDSQAYFWFRRAAEQGYAPGIYRLGRCYLEGRGVTASEANAIECFRAAARLGNSSAKAELLSLERD